MSPGVGLGAPGRGQNSRLYTRRSPSQSMSPGGGAWRPLGGVRTPPSCTPATAPHSRCPPGVGLGAPRAGSELLPVVHPPQPLTVDFPRGWGSAPPGRGQNSSQLYTRRGPSQSMSPGGGARRPRGGVRTPPSCTLAAAPRG